MSSFVGIEERTLENITESDMIDGLDLTADDAGQPYIVIVENEFLDDVGIDVGDRITLLISGGGMLGGGGESEEVTFELVGIKSMMSMNMSFSGGGAYVPVDALPENMSPSNVSVLADVEEEQIDALRRQLDSVSGAFTLPTSIFTDLIESLLGTFMAFPTMVAVLGLAVGGVVIANSVALTTMERRHEIAIMKSIGLQRGRVLAMLLLENGILGLIGGLIGVGIGLVGLAIMIGQTGAPGEAVPYGTAFLLMGLCIVVSLIAALTSAWGASGEKPLNVLRYE